MKQNLLRILCLGAAALFALSPLSAEISYRDAKDMVADAFEEVLDREPTRSEMAEFVDFVIEDDLSYRELKGQLRREFNASDRHNDHSHDHDSYRNDDHSSHRHYKDKEYYQPRRWVESIFEERVGRLPTRKEMDRYCHSCLDNRYSKSQLDRMIRDDYDGVYEPYSDDDYYRYDYDRYSSSEEIEIIINEAYRDILDRDADEDGLRNYRKLMIDKGWSERRIRDHLANSPEALWDELSIVVVRAYEDLLDREPSRRERDGYIDDMIRHKWNERKLRDMIRKSHEFKYDRPVKMIKQAYQEVLLREVDPGSIEPLRKEILRKDWGIKQVKKHLMKSSEYRTTTIPKMIERAYQEVLGRKSDPTGFRFYSTRAHQGWTFEDIKKHMKGSDEYKRNH